VPFQLSVAVAEGPDAAMAIKLAGAPLELSYEGRLAIKGGVAAEGTLSLARLAYKDVKLGPARLPISVAGGVARLTLAELALYGGRGEGNLTIDTTGGTPAVAASLKLADVSLQPLLKDAAGAKWLAGRGAVTLALSGQGGSERQLLETLQGQVQLVVADGAVSGFDVERMLSGVQRGRLDRLAPRAKDRTSFSALTGSFDIAAGVARTSDLKLASKQVELKGEGQIELAARRIDVVLETKLDGGAPAEGAAINIGTLQIPIAIKGPLDRPELSIKGQEALSATIGALAKGFKSREVQDAILDLLGGARGKRAKAGDEPDSAPKKD
jgi:AsmA protein